ncbi:MAG: ATP synthase F0 subunit B [Myxococcales bacterium]|nr:ATP synthase F0 subunit B [Myxococcales bacterium]
MATFLSGGALIDIDGTLFVQLGLFFILFLILKGLVFRPMVALFEAREEAIDGARAEAKKMTKEAAQKGDAFEEQMRTVRTSAQEERDRLRQEGQKLERAMLDKAREETQKMLSESTAKLDSDAARLRGEIRTQVPGLARDVASKLLGREVA